MTTNNTTERHMAATPATPAAHPSARAAQLPESFLPASDPRCITRVVTTNGEFDALETEWTKLFERSEAGIFQSYEWQRTWWKCFAGPNDRLQIMLFTYEQALIGIAPLYAHTMRALGIPAAVHLRSIGAGLSDYLDFIVQPGYERMVFNAFALRLRTTVRDWDVLDLRDVNETSPLYRMLPRVLDNHGLTSIEYLGNVCPYIVLPSADGGDAPDATYNYKRKLKRLQQNFSSTVDRYRSEADDIRTGLEAFARIHGERWKSLGYPSAFDDTEHLDFHIEFSKKFARRGWLRLLVLTVDGVPTAVNYGFHYRHRIYMYHSNAFGPADVMKCSPGFLVRSMAMAEGIREGMRVFDFLRGDDSYKYTEWGASDSKNYLLRVVSPKARVRFAFFLFAEFAAKAADRARRELYEYRRFKITRPRTPRAKAGYAAIKGGNLLVLSANFLLRHMPSKALRAIQFRQRSPHEEL